VRVTDPFRLVVPAPVHLPSYRAALEAGWSPSNVESEVHRQRELDQLDRNAMAYLMSLEDTKASGEPIILPDGSSVPRLPSFRRWMWDGEFCGHVGFRWQAGTAALPPHVLGHVGFSVVAWKRGQGYATQALKALLPEARAKGLPYIELTATADNPASCRTIEKAGGLLVERFAEHVYHGGQEVLRYRITL
jgi:predicted acetyltransferase